MRFENLSYDLSQSAQRHFHGKHFSYRKYRPMKLSTLLFGMVLAMNLFDLGYADEPSSKPALWKLTKSDSTTNSSVFSRPWSGPKLNLPKVQAFESVKAKTGQFYQSTKTTTIRWWRGTVELLTPGDNSSNSSPAGGGGAWFFRKKEEPQVSTMSDFMRLDRPKF
jgi:hypothetical protein